MFWMIGDLTCAGDDKVGLNPRAGEGRQFPVVVVEGVHPELVGAWVGQGGQRHVGRVLGHALPLLTTGDLFPRALTFAATGHLVQAVLQHRVVAVVQRRLPLVPLHPDRRAGGTDHPGWAVQLGEACTNMKNTR